MAFGFILMVDEAAGAKPQSPVILRQKSAVITVANGKLSGKLMVTVCFSQRYGRLDVSPHAVRLFPHASVAEYYLYKLGYKRAGAPVGNYDSYPLTKILVSGYTQALVHIFNRFKHLSGSVTGLNDKFGGSERFIGDIPEPELRHKRV